MLFYILPYCFLVLLSILILKLRTKRLTLFLYIALLPAILLVILRGNVGVDIEMYLRVFTVLKYNEVYPHRRLEPGFMILCEIISFFVKNERIAINIISSLTTVLLISCFSKRKLDIIIFSLLVFPFFFYDMTMNGIRYGLSFSLAAIAIQNLFNKKHVKFVIWALVSASIQYSSVIIFLPFLLSFLTKKQLIYLGVLLVFVGGYLFSFKYFQDKFNAYSALFSPSIFSGLSNLVTSLGLIFMIAIYYKNVLKAKLFYYILFMIIGAYFLSYITYAGLRVQGVVLFLIMLYLKGVIENLRKIQEVYTIIFIIGIFGFFLRIRNFNAVVEGVNTPFIPYHFFWQI